MKSRARGRVGALGVVAWGCLGGASLAQPPNDECSGAIAVFGGVNPVATTLGATTSAPVWTCANAGADVGFTYVATCTGTAELDLGETSARPEAVPRAPPRRSPSPSPTP